MKIFGIDLWSDKKVSSMQEEIKQLKKKVEEPKATTLLFSAPYNGEKNLGEMGPIIDYVLDFDSLRARSWQCYHESEIAQSVIKKYVLWIIGGGLKLQANPLKQVLKMEKIELDSEDFNESVESLFNVFSESENCDYSNMRNLQAIAEEAYMNAIIGGDVLMILRLIDNQVKIQLVDGCHVVSPMGGSEYTDAQARGNRIRHGVEISSTGEHVAYFVKTGPLKMERIPVKGETSGIKMAFMIYGLKYRLDNVRGVPLVAVVLETLKKLERYKEATVASAEERAKIVMQIVHQAFSTGENVLEKRLRTAFDVEGSNDIPEDVDGDKLANTVAVSTNKSVFNMPVGSELKSLDSKSEILFKDFYGVNIDIVCAALPIPPEVAMSKYDSNFSASRAALKDWEHTVFVHRKKFSFQFYRPIYNFFLHVHVLLNKINAPGYTAAWKRKNNYVIDSYRNARFVGSSIPHIDPLKEVMAERAKLGSAGAHLPLGTVEQATENLNGGDSDSNMAQFALELEEAEKLGIKPQPEKPIKEQTDE